MATADLAQDVHIRQEVHFDPPLPFSLAGFAPPARDIERKSSRLVTAFTRFWQHGVQISDLGKDSGVRRRIRAWRAANRRLVNANDLVDILRAGDGLVHPRLFARAVEFLGQSAG